MPHVLNSEYCRNEKNESVTNTSTRDSLNEIVLPSYI